MKCSMTEDLLPLYVDDMCSEETKKEIEAHLKTCEKCAEKLKNYRTEIQVDAKEATGADSKDKAVRDSMKKVKKKLSFRKAVAVISSLLLVVVVIGMGVLLYGERTGSSMNFTTVFNVMTLNRVAKAACDRDFEPLLAITHYDLNSMYIGNRFIKESGTTIRDVQREKLEKVFQQTFGDAAVKYEIENITYEYDNDFFSGISDDYEVMNDLRNPAGSIMVRFYSDNAEISVTFFQHADRKFSYEDARFGQAADKMNFESITSDEVVLKILAYSVKKDSTNLRLWNMLIWQKPKNHGERERSVKLDERLQQLTDAGWNITNFYFEPDSFDFEEYCMIYKVHFVMENGKGEMAMMAQRFDQQDSHFYIRANDTAVMEHTSDAMSEDVKTLALNLFTLD